VGSQALEKIGQNVRQERKQRQLTIKSLSVASGLSVRFLSELEAGRANISVLNLYELARALAVPVMQLLPDVSAEAQPSKVISLLGLRGAGKSTVGKALAQRLGVPFFELDGLVEKEAGMKLSELFAIHGEEYFRRLELSILERFLAQNVEGVLATGGGLVTSAKAFELCRQRTCTVWLKATPEEHWNRVVGQGDLRPMRDRPSAMVELRRRLREREPFYKQASVICSTSGKTIQTVVSDVLRQLEN
jgi:XRE family aerobic/anaerobic benzoate catabolism transcriptional regulator